MVENQPDLLADHIDDPFPTARKTLLPTWIKIFTWIFLVMIFLVPIVLVVGLMGSKTQLALYGLETDEQLSATGMLITVLFLIKGVTAFGLLKEKDWAIKAGLVDAIIGIIICTLVMFYPILFLSGKLSLRLELALLIPYLLKLLKIRTEWESTL